MARTATRAFEPKDRTKREHVGEVDRCVWSDPDQPTVILKLRDGASVIGPALAEQFAAGQLYRFHGRWAEGKFGPEFRFDTVTRDTPLTRGAIVKYLSDTCRNVGKKTAESLADKYGSDAVRVLREEPAKVTADQIMNATAAEEAAADLRRFAHVERTKVDLVGLFAGRGFPGKLIDRCIGTWGVRAPDVIRRNPFVLLTRKLPGCGWKRCDKFYLDLQKPPAAMKRQALCAWAAIRDDRTGSTWVDADDVARAVKETIPSADPFRAMVLLRRAGWVRVRRDGTRRFVTLRDRADAEQRIATAVRRLSRFPSLWPAELLTTTAEGDGLPSTHQAGQVGAATRGAVGCFVGGPGTGKTHTLAFLLKQVIAEHGPEAVAVAAPTGKAAVRAGESLRSRGLSLRATTIHRLLEIGRNGHDGDGWGFKRNAARPLDVRFLVVDESSMIDTGLMADLLDAVPDRACVLFIGDPHQLPPVGHGAPLRDLLTAVPSGELTEVRRNAGSIVRGCAAIKAGTPVRFDERLDLDAADPANLKNLDCGSTEALDVLADVLKGMQRFDPAWETQIITALNDKSDLSRKKLNERFGLLLNPDGRPAKLNPFRVGDKIICLKNTTLKSVVPIGAFRNPVAVPGWAYVIGVSPAGLHKIGFTTRTPEQRLAELAAETRYPDLRVVHRIACRDPRDLERQLHRCFSTKRRAGEWFDLTPDDVASLAEVLSADALGPLAPHLADSMADAANYQTDGEEVYCANGEIGRVVAVSERHTVARFGGADAPLVQIANKKKRAVQEEEQDGEAGASADFDHAWAITVHRSQGSEWPCVLVMCDDAGAQIADRNFWYTAISRARAACLVIGPRGVFEKQVRRQAIARRRTFLPELLRAE